MEQGTCQEIAELPQSVRHTFVVSQDITAEEHVRMQAALQAFVDNCLVQNGQFPIRRQRDGGRRGLQTGLGAGLQGNHRVRDRLAPEGGAGDQCDCQGEAGDAADRARRRDQSN